MTERRHVSIIVPVRNDVHGVRELIGLLADQTLPEDLFEIVVGDDGSDAGALEEIGTSDGRVRLIRGPPRTSYAARNLAAAAATGDVLAFCDSDCRPQPSWLEEGLAALEDADVVAGEVICAVPVRPSLWSLLTIDMFFDQARNVRLGQAVTANLFVHRTLFERLKGFDASLPSGGDYDFVARAVKSGARLRYEPRAVVRHPTMDGAPRFLRKVWDTNRWSGFRNARDGKRPDLVAMVTAFVPVIGIARARRRALRPALGLDRSRLDATGVESDLGRNLRALAALYLLVAYVAGLGRASGWLSQSFRRIHGG